MNATQASTGGLQGLAGQPASATVRTEPRELWMSSATRAASTYPSQSRLLSAPQLTDAAAVGGAGAVACVQPTKAATNAAASATLRRARSGTAGELRVGPVRVVVVVAVAGVGDHQTQGRAPGDVDAQHLGRGAGAHRARVVELGAVAPDLEDERGDGAGDLIVHPHAGGEQRAGPGHRVVDLRCGVGAQALGVGHPVEGE